MAQITEEYVETVKRTKVLKTTCDRCGQEIPESKRDHYETLKHDKGYTFSADAFGGEVVCVEDLCPDCIKWVIETLEKGGVKFNRYDY